MLHTRPSRVSGCGTLGENLWTIYLTVCLTFWSAPYATLTVGCLFWLRTSACPITKPSRKPCFCVTLSFAHVLLCDMIWGSCVQDSGSRTTPALCCSGESCNKGCLRGFTRGIYRGHKFELLLLLVRSAEEAWLGCPAARQRMLIPLPHECWDTLTPPCELEYWIPRETYGSTERGRRHGSMRQHGQHSTSPRGPDSWHWEPFYICV